MPRTKVAAPETPQPPPTNVVYLQGTPKDEHLRIEREGDTLLVVSKILRIGIGAQQSLYQERVLFSLSVAQWQAITRALKLHDEAKA